MSALFAWLLPVLAALLVLVPGRTRQAVFAVAPWIPLALLWPVIDGGEVRLPDLLLATSLGADAVAAPLLVLCAVLWTLGGVFARATVTDDRLLFWSGWLASLSGLALLLLARDLAGFYIGYAMLTLASWLLIVHARSDEAWRAGRIYLVMALAGEMAVLAGVVAIAAQVGNAPLAMLQAPCLLGSAWCWLLFAGFAVKMGVIPLHLWLPLAHPVAPVPASAVLSGVIVKAGLMGWLRLVPPGAGLGSDVDLLLVLGLGTAFAGVLLGLFQQRLKVVLAYSTISQMGLVLAAFAAVLATDDPAAAYPWLGVVVLHHGLNKGALFLACGCAPGRGPWRGLLIALPSLALAGAPFTTGALSKYGIKHLFHDAGLGDGWLLALSLSSTATALLLWRFWQLARRETSDKPAQPAWIAATVIALLLPWLWTGVVSLDPRGALAAWWPSTWPLLLAAILVWPVSRAAARLRLPAGDLVVVLEPAVSGLVRAWRRMPLGSGSETPVLRPSGRPGHPAFRAVERYLRAIPVAGFMILLIGAALWLIEWWSRGGSAG